MRSFGTTAGATAECAGVVVASAKSVSVDAVFFLLELFATFAKAVCNFCWSCFCKTAFVGAIVGIFG